MTALIQDRKTPELDPNSVIPQLLSFPAEASTKVFGGSMVATNAAGNAVPASANAALKIWGRCERQTDNSAGAAGALQVPVRPGCYPWNQGTGADAITAANVGQPCYASDDNTVNLTDGGGTRPFAGTIWAVLSNGQVYVLTPGQSAPSDQSGAVQHLAIDIPLATIQAQTSGTAFNIGAALPANARVLEVTENVVTALSGGGLSAATSTIQGGTDGAGTLVASHTVFTGAAAANAQPGSNPYANRGGQQLKMTLTATGAALSAITAGHLSVDVFYVEVS